MRVVENNGGNKALLIKPECINYVAEREAKQTGLRRQETSCCHIKRSTK